MRIYSTRPENGASLPTAFRVRSLQSRIVKYFIVLVLGLISIPVLSSVAHGQRPGNQTARGFSVMGDVRVEEVKGGEPGPTSLDVTLYTNGMQAFARQKVVPNGRYRFMDVFVGEYIVIVEVEGREVARSNVAISNTSPTETVRDFDLAPRSNGGKPATGVVSAADLYDRSAISKALYKKSTQAIESKNYKDAIATLKQVVEADKGDYPAWSDLGMLYFIQKDLENADKSYAGSLAAKPDYFPALLSQGRVKLAKADLDGGIAVLEAAVKLDPKSASANFFLGEAYLQAKKGSKAVGYMNEAIALDPVGMADAHLRLASLYNGAKLTERAAAEYEAFLKVKPDYPDRKKLEEYITANKKP